jgi:hypothetical protein
VKSWSSAVATYVTINWSITDQAAYDATNDGVFFDLLDENGDRIDSVGGGSSGDGLTEITLNPTAQFPESLTIQAFNCWTKERYESVTLYENRIAAKQHVNFDEPDCLDSTYNDEWRSLNPNGPDRDRLTEKP